MIYIRQRMHRSVDVIIILKITASGSDLEVNHSFRIMFMVRELIDGPIDFAFIQTLTKIDPNHDNGKLHQWGQSRLDLLGVDSQFPNYG